MLYKTRFWARCQQTAAQVIVLISGVDEVVKVFQREVRSNAAVLRAFAIIVCAVCAVAALFLGVLTSWDLYLTGFPDGHLTDYDKAVEAPKRILMWVEWGFVLVFLVLAFSPIGTRARAVGLHVALIALALVVIVELVGVPWYFGTHLGLDHGIGG
jgi:hypothetical protein